jgi:hypothetical protein
MLGREVEVRLPARGGKGVVVGVVEKVCRNIFDDMVEVTVGGRLHSFREPKVILCDGRQLLFVYGIGGNSSDEEFFNEVCRTSTSGETFQEVLKRTEPKVEPPTTFRLGRRVRRSRRWHGRGRMAAPSVLVTPA